MELTIRFRQGAKGAEKPPRKPFPVLFLIVALSIAAALAFAFLWLAEARRPQVAAINQPLLTIEEAAMTQSGGLAVVKGKVRNISAEPQQYVWVRSIFLDKTGRPLIRSIEVLIDKSTLSSGDSSAFKVYAAWDEAIVGYRLEFTKVARQPIAVHDFRTNVADVNSH